MAYSIKLTIDTVEYDVTESVITDSLKISYSLFNNLEPTTNKLEFKLLGSSSAIPYLLSTNDKVSVEAKDGSTYLFKGYLTDNFAWQITNRGKQPISMSAEDPGIKLLKRNWVSANGLYTTFSDRRLSKPTDRTNSVVHIICTLAGVTVSEAIPAVDTRITANILDSDNATYWDVLKQMTFELGYVFYFTESGELCLYKVAKTTITPSFTFSTSTNIIAESDNKGIDVKKQLKTYKQIEVSWQEWETKNDFYVFRDTTNGNNQYDCLIELAGGAYYPSGADSSNFVYQEYKTEDGSKIINVNNALLDYVVDSGITVEFENLGRKGKIRFHNTSAVSAYIRKLKVKATSAIVEKNSNITKAGENTNPILKYTAKYIHDALNASYFANTIKDYYLYSNYSYDFKSKDDVALGSVVALKDTTWNTVNENVLITEKEKKESRAYSYTAIGIDQFNLLSSVSRDITQTTGTNLQPIPLTSLDDPTITIGDTTISLGGSTSSLSGVSVSGSEFNYDKQKVYAHLIPGSNYQILTQQNKGTELSDVFTIYELLAPYTSATETTYSMHNVVSGWDDWVRDVSFHNYGSKMKAVDVISHFTGTTAGDWQWVSRYTNGTDYNMVERYLMTLEGDTGNVKIGEDNTLVSAARGKLDIRSKGWITQPSAIISIDSSNGDQPQSALQVQNGYNFAYGGNLTTLKLLNSSDNGTVLKLENAGTGNYLAVDNKLYIDNDGSIKTKGSYGFLTGSALDPELVLYKGGTGFLNLRRYGEDYTILNVWAPPSWAGSREATLVLQRGDEPNVEYIDIYNNGYDSETQYGMRIQKRGTGEYRPFVFDYYDGITKNKIYEITPDRKISNNYVSGSLGTGWALDYNSSVPDKSYLEVDNLLVRDTIRTHIFQKDVIKATNGQLYVSDSGVIAKTYDGTEPYVVHLDVDKSATFSVNDEIVVKDVNLSSGTVTATTRFKIDSIGTVANGIQPYTVSVIEGTLWNLQTGMTAVRASGGSVLIDASTAYRPFIDVLNNGVTKARLGNLDGISGCSGYGLYSDNVFLTGKITATSGSFTGTISAGSGSTIGGWTSATDKLSSGNARLYSSGILSLGSADGYNTTNSIYLDGANSRFSLGTKLTYTGDTLTINGNGTFSGSITSDSATITGGTLTVGNNFSVTNDGTLSATNANISGGGYFTGDVETSALSIQQALDIPNLILSGTWYPSTLVNYFNSYSMQTGRPYPATGTLYTDWYIYNGNFSTGSRTVSTVIKVNSTTYQINAVEGGSKTYISGRPATSDYGNIDVSTMSVRIIAKTKIDAGDTNYTLNIGDSGHAFGDVYCKSIQIASDAGYTTSNFRRVHSRCGFLVSDNLHGTYSEDVIFQTFSPILQNIGDKIIASGRYWKTGQTVVSYVERTGSNYITFYGMDDGGTLRGETAVEGSGTTRAITVAV